MNYFDGPVCEMALYSYETFYFLQSRKTQQLIVNSKVSAVWFLFQALNLIKLRIDLRRFNLKRHFSLLITVLLIVSFYFFSETIEDLTLRLSEHEKKVKELENTIRLQEQNIKAKDGSINKQKTALEKLKNEMKEKTADLVEKSGVIEKLNNDFKTKDVSERFGR